MASGGGGVGADVTTALSASQTAPTTGEYFIFYEFSFLIMQNTHLVFPTFMAQGHGSGTMGKVVGGVVRGCGRPAVAGARVYRARPVAISQFLWGL